jgi:Cysteine-rich secretory protein family
MVLLTAGLFFCHLLAGVVTLPGCGGGHNAPVRHPTESLRPGHADDKLDVRAAAALISSYRTENGLGPVSVDPELMRLARNQAVAMAAHNELEHNVAGPFERRIQNSRFDASVAVENIAAGYPTLAEAFGGWRKSPEHRANMLNRDVTRMGIAEAYAPHTRYKVFWSLILAKPDDHQRRLRSGARASRLRSNEAVHYGPVDAEGLLQ